ncbi:hypothetical protein Tco_0922585 [Tanacetum coccineum]|uniref:Uncharacterized protein n=1 Tax=Tanacetum coccineum TaxID=301880 RepID=A0ABQ5CYK3_9ASTR
METESQNSIQEGNSSREVRGVRSGQPPSMAGGNMSSGGTHSYSHDQSAPSWNALRRRDSSPMMIDSDNVQEFIGDEFSWYDIPAASSASIVQGKGW